MKYTLDSNILINMERLYPRDIFPSLWGSIEHLVERGGACICEPVLRELKRGDDCLHAWAKDLPGFLCSTQEEEVQTVVEIAPFKQNLMSRVGSGSVRCSAVGCGRDWISCVMCNRIVA